MLVKIKLMNMQLKDRDNSIVDNRSENIHHFIRITSANQLAICQEFAEPDMNGRLENPLRRPMRE